MTVRRLVSELGPGEFQEWMAFERLEPTPEAVLAAQICAVTANAGGGKKGGGSFSVQDFLPVQGDAGRRQSDDQVYAALTAVFGPGKPPEPDARKDG